MKLKAIIPDYFFSFEDIRIHFQNNEIEVDDDIGKRALATRHGEVMLRQVWEEPAFEIKPAESVADAIIEEVTAEAEVVKVSTDEMVRDSLRQDYLALTGKRADLRWNIARLEKEINDATKDAGE